MLQKVRFLVLPCCGRQFDQAVVRMAASSGEAGLQVLKADVQAWYLDVQQRIALQPGFVENLRFGLTFRVSFNQILFVSGQTEVAALTEEQSDHLAGVLDQLQNLIMSTIVSTKTSLVHD